MLALIAQVIQQAATDPTPIQEAALGSLLFLTVFFGLDFATDYL